MPGAKSKAAASQVFLGATAPSVKSADAWFHILPVPYAGTGADTAGMGNAPEAIILASAGMENWDGRSVPARHGIHTHEAVDCKGSVEKILERISSAASPIAGKDRFPVALGGAGTITYGMVKGLLDAGTEDFGVVQIDAQADLKDEVDGDAWHESCVMKRIVDEDISLFQLGVRVLSKEESDARKVYGVKYYDADFLVSRNISKVELPGEFPDKIYLSIDIDGFDPSVFPSPGAVPGGLGWWQVLSIIESLSQQADIIGFDLTEYSPSAGQSFHDTAAAMLVYKIMGIVERARL